MTFRVGVVGLGYWGPNLIRALHEVPGFEVRWMCDLREDVLARIGSRYPAVSRTACIEDVLDDAAVDTVVIATPVSTHFALAAASLDAGKHTFVEKPLAGSSTEAFELVELARRRDLVLMPGHTFLYSPPVRTVKQLIDAGELGEIYFISTSRVNLGIHQADISVAWDLGPHDFSILRYWLGETPAWVSALARGCVIPGIPDVAFVNSEFSSGAIAHVELSWLAPGKLRRTTLVGSRKMVVYDDTSNEPVRIFDAGVSLPDPGSFGEHRLSYRTGDILSPHVVPAEPLVVELRDFAASIADGVEPVSSAEIGLDVIRVIEAVESSLAQAGSRSAVAPSLGAGIW